MLVQTADGPLLVNTRHVLFARHHRYSVFLRMVGDKEDTTLSFHTVEAAKGYWADLITAIDDAEDMGASLAEEAMNLVKAVKDLRP
jgi:hypothetical protein